MAHDVPRKDIPTKLTVRHGRKATTTVPYVDNLWVKLSPWPRYRLVRDEASWRGGIKRGIILKYGQIKTAGYDLRDVPVVRSGYASTLQTTDLRPLSTRIERGQWWDTKKLYIFTDETTENAFKKTVTRSVRHQQACPKLCILTRGIIF